MGADLCGFIMVGPKKITTKKAQQAIKTIKSIQDILRPAIEKLGEGEETTVREIEALVGAENSRKLAKMLGVKTPAKAYMTVVLGEMNVYEEFKELVDANAEEDVFEFVRMWNGDTFFRDQMSRYTPNGKQKIVVVGERTWGDGPEPESGWGLTTRISKMGLLGQLGIN